MEAARAEGVRLERERVLREAEEARLEARRRDAARDLLLARRCVLRAVWPRHAHLVWLHLLYCSNAHCGCTHYGRHAQRAQGLRLQDAASALRASLSSERCARGERRREARALELRELSVARVASAQVPFYG